MPAMRYTFSAADMLSDELRAALRRRLSEIIGAALIAIAGIAALALATWSVQDPSLSHATPARPRARAPRAVGCRHGRGGRVRRLPAREQVLAAADWIGRRDRRRDAARPGVGVRRAALGCAALPGCDRDRHCGCYDACGGGRLRLAPQRGRGRSRREADEESKARSR